MIMDFRVGGTNYFFIGYEGHEKCENEKAEANFIFIQIERDVTMFVDKREEGKWKQKGQFLEQDRERTQGWSFC